MIVICIMCPIKNVYNIYYLKLNWQVREDMQKWKVLTPILKELKGW